jgi:hypothetical protein
VPAVPPPVPATAPPDPAAEEPLPPPDPEDKEPPEPPEPVPSPVEPQAVNQSATIPTAKNKVADEESLLFIMACLPPRCVVNTSGPCDGGDDLARVVGFAISHLAYSPVRDFERGSGISNQ